MTLKLFPLLFPDVPLQECDILPYRVSRARGEVPAVGGVHVRSYGHDEPVVPVTGVPLSVMVTTQTGHTSRCAHSKEVVNIFIYRIWRGLPSQIEEDAEASKTKNWDATQQ